MAWSSGSRRCSDTGHSRNSGGPAGETAKENKDGNTTSLKCYNCDSCEKPSDNQTKENCGSCRKYIKSGKVQRYECSDKQGCGDLKDQKGDDKTECCSDKNLCNSTGKNKINTILLGSTISLVLIALFENTIFS
uniref:Uncharacterized protein n=1 Tax=Trichobilharzia regenti TaxID=157069 RepID=A0AA85JLU7_TRIRE|nr:unnamed protein product [Trichobilharzia regenti]